MEEFLKNARRHLEEMDLQTILHGIDLSRFDKEQLRRVDLTRDATRIRKQLEQLDRENREEEAASQGFLGGVLLGIVVGAVLALIFAPRSGSETREMVAETASGLMHKTEDLVGHKDETADTDAGEPTLPTEPAIERDFGTTPGNTI